MHVIQHLPATTITHDPAAAGARGDNHWRAHLSVEVLLLLASLLFTIGFNVAFWSAAIDEPLRQWRLAVSLFLLMTALHACLLGLVATRSTIKPLLWVLLPLTALVSHMMMAYGVFVDADMLRNVVHTDRAEASELFTAGLLPALLLGLLPLPVLSRIELSTRPRRRALVARLLFLLAMAVVGIGGALLSAPEIASLMRNQREVRYLVTPANYVVSLASVLLSEPPGAHAALLPVGTDARQSPRAAGSKPRLLLVVVGETARAANWGLDGYPRQTTPRLAQVSGLVNFTRVSACGSSTEVSLPCMFSPHGRADYDAKRIRHSQSVLHVMDHAGVPVLWRDNQSGCKSVCEGLDTERLQGSKDPAHCIDGHCHDGILLQGLDARIAPGPGDRVVVLHQMGNHGPSYFERYPPAFRRFTPACESADLGSCDRQSIVNAYDNALLYTDHVLAEAIIWLQGKGDYDTAMLYVSDHGESLGEKGLYLHGVPYPIAPSEQLHVPMVAWFSPGFEASTDLDQACVARRASQPASHDNLFSSLLGLMDVQTGVYRAELDLFAGCRRAVRAAGDGT